MSNRVEELESRVTELQAAVDGLTEELVETRERLRALEEDDAGAAGNETVTSGATGGRTIDAEDGNAEVSSADDAAGDSDAPNDPDDPDPGTDAEADEESSSESTSDTTSTSDSDDIIVA